jgi:hypothetical protein
MSLRTFNKDFPTAQCERDIILARPVRKITIAA